MLLIFFEIFNSTDLVNWYQVRYLFQFATIVRNRFSLLYSPVLSHLVVHGMSTAKEHANWNTVCLAFLLRQDTIHHLADPMSVCNCCDVSKLTCQSLPVAEHCAPYTLNLGSSQHRSSIWVGWGSLVFFFRRRVSTFCFVLGSSCLIICKGICSFRHVCYYFAAMGQESTLFTTQNR